MIWYNVLYQVKQITNTICEKKLENTQDKKKNKPQT